MSWLKLFRIPKYSGPIFIIIIIIVLNRYIVHLVRDICELYRTDSDPRKQARSSSAVRRDSCVNNLKREKQSKLLN